MVLVVVVRGIGVVAKAQAGAGDPERDILVTFNNTGADAGSAGASPPYRFRKRYAVSGVVRQLSRAIERGLDERLPRDRLAFLYLPYMHSESLADQDRSVGLFGQAGLDANLEFARHHRDIVRRFGRFPHRNAVLRRDSTAEEIEWLASPEAFNP